jgi:hypothetical protein
MKLTVFRFVLILLAGIALGSILTNTLKYFRLQKALSDASGIDKVLGAFQKIEADSSTVKFRLVFHNNPLEFNNMNTMWVALNQVLVYEGSYSDQCEVMVPKRFLGKGMRPYLLIKSGDKLFDGWKKEPVCFILNTEPGQINVLNVYFTAEFTAPGNYIMFSGWLGQ